MTRVLFALVLLFTGWIGYQATGAQRRERARVARETAAREAAREDSIAEQEALRALRKATGSGASRMMRGLDAGPRTPAWVERLQARRMATPNEAPARDEAADAARIKRYGQYTYLDAVAALNKGRLARWPTRTTVIKVWVQGNPGIPGWTSQYRSVARGALGTWDAAQLPFRIVASDDSTDADVFVLWTRKFYNASFLGGRIGETSRLTDEHGWILASTITIAIEDPGGKPLDVYIIQNAARHEIGHVIGLDHSPVAEDIMAATAGRQDRLSERDINTARLLYALSPGPFPGYDPRTASGALRPSPGELARGRRR